MLCTLNQSNRFLPDNWKYLATPNDNSAFKEPMHVKFTLNRMVAAHVWLSGLSQSDFLMENSVEVLTEGKLRYIYMYIT